MRKLLILLMLAATAPAFAGFVSDEDMCKKGNRDSCRILELREQIDMTRFDGEHAQYKFVLGPRTLLSIPTNNAADRQMQMKTAACSFYSEVWLGERVAEYGRLMDLRPVDRARFSICMSQS